GQAFRHRSCNCSLQSLMTRERCMSALPESADYPIHPPAADLIRDDAQAQLVAERVAAVLLEQDAERDRSRQVPVDIVDLYSNIRSVSGNRFARSRPWCGGSDPGNGRQHLANHSPHVIARGA